MKRYTFGKAITAVFSYEDLSEPSSDNPSIAVFSEKPTESEAESVNGTYKIGSTITSWDDGSLANTKEFIIPAISVPANIDVNGSKVYYVAINYNLTTSADTQLVVLPILVSKAIGTLSGHELSIQDVVDVFPTIEDYVSDENLAKFLRAAIDKLERDLLKKNIRLDQVTNQNDLKYALALKASSLSCYSEFINEGDQMYIRAKDFDTDYQKELDSLEIKIDTDQDGASDQGETKKRYFVFNNA